MALDLGSFLAFDLPSFVASFVLLFSVFDVIGTVPVFLALTHDLSDQRAVIVRDSVVIATVILLVFALAGQLIFRALGITLDDFRIAGGIILFIIALDNLRGKISQTRTIAAGEIAAFPLVILLNSVVTYLILERASWVQKALGNNGTQVFTRIVGLLIAAIGIAFIREGILGIIKSMGGSA